MGVKSTVNLTRAQAILRMVDLHTPKARQELGALYSRYSNDQLEDFLELMNDAAKGGEGFENYRITDE